MVSFSSLTIFSFFDNTLPAAKPSWITSLIWWYFYYYIVFKNKNILNPSKTVLRNVYSIIKTKDITSLYELTLFNPKSIINDLIKLDYISDNDNNIAFNLFINNYKNDKIKEIIIIFSCILRTKIEKSGYSGSNLGGSI